MLKPFQTITVLILPTIQVEHNQHDEITKPVSATFHSANIIIESFVIVYDNGVAALPPSS